MNCIKLLKRLGVMSVSSSSETKNHKSLTHESKGRCSHMEMITTWFSIVCAVVSVITIFINLWLNS